RPDAGQQPCRPRCVVTRGAGPAAYSGNGHDPPNLLEFPVKPFIAAVLAVAMGALVAGCAGTGSAGSANASSAATPTGGSGVTVFGTIDMGVARITGDQVSRTGMSVSGANISRLGFKGSEDLGGGLGAGFWLEAGLMPSSGATQSSTSFFNRRATLSLTGNF
ncbi:hypothetical protein KXX47_001297, partial [Aspergillus fumigatus]